MFALAIVAISRNRVPRSMILIRPRLLLTAAGGAGRGLPASHRLFILLLGDVVPVDPGESHFVNGPVSVSCPICRVGIAAMGGRIVVERDDMEDGARRNDRRYIVGVF